MATRLRAGGARGADARDRAQRRRRGRQPARLRLGPSRRIRRRRRSAWPRAVESLPEPRRLSRVWTKSSRAGVPSSSPTRTSATRSAMPRSSTACARPSRARRRAARAWPRPSRATRFACSRTRMNTRWPGCMPPPLRAGAAARSRATSEFACTWRSPAAPARPTRPAGQAKLRPLDAARFALAGQAQAAARHAVRRLRLCHRATPRACPGRRIPADRRRPDRGARRRAPAPSPRSRACPTRSAVSAPSSAAPRRPARGRRRCWPPTRPRIAARRRRHERPEMPTHWQRIARASLMASGFRPFYLLGALYAPLLALGGVGAFFGIVDLSGVARTRAVARARDAVRLRHRHRRRHLADGAAELGRHAGDSRRAAGLAGGGLAARSGRVLGGALAAGARGRRWPTCCSGPCCSALLARRSGAYRTACTACCCRSCSRSRRRTWSTTLRARRRSPRAPARPARRGLGARRALHAQGRRADADLHRQRAARTRARRAGALPDAAGGAGTGAAGRAGRGSTSPAARASSPAGWPPPARWCTAFAPHAGAAGASPISRCCRPCTWASPGWCSPSC